MSKRFYLLHNSLMRVLKKLEDETFDQWEEGKTLGQVVHDTKLLAEEDDLLRRLKKELT